MPQVRERYRKLPGRRRGFLSGSSVWLGSDHLLLVKSSRFREEYRRFYFRDIQAIVTAAAPRFHISTRSALVGALWLWALAVVIGEPTPIGLEWAIGLTALPLVITWVYQSATCSCRCRIYTAVSSEELPSVYRIWTARRFLEKVEPYLAQVQGAIQEDWAEALEQRQVGPLPEGRIGRTLPGVAAPLPPPSPSSRAARTPLTTFFVASLCLGGVADLLTVSARGKVGRWVLLGFILLQLSAAVAVVIQNYMGKLRSSLRNLALVALVSIAVWYYAVQMGVGMALAYRNSQVRDRQTLQMQVEPLAALDYPVARGVAGGMGLVLGLAGVLLLLLGGRPSEDKVSFNV